MYVCFLCRIYKTKWRITYDGTKLLLKFYRVKGVCIMMLFTVPQSLSFCMTFNLSEENIFRFCVILSRQGVNTEIYYTPPPTHIEKVLNYFPLCDRIFGGSVCVYANEIFCERCIWRMMLMMIPVWMYNFDISMKTNFKSFACPFQCKGNAQTMVSFPFWHISELLC